MLKSCGPVTGLFHEYELKLAQLVNHFMPAVEKFRMLGSGTEGVMAAIRAARAYTKNITRTINIKGFDNLQKDPGIRKYRSLIPGIIFQNI